LVTGASPPGWRPEGPHTDEKNRFNSIYQALLEINAAEKAHFNRAQNEFRQQHMDMMQVEQRVMTWIEELSARTRRVEGCQVPEVPQSLIELWTLIGRVVYVVPVGILSIIANLFR